MNTADQELIVLAAPRVDDPYYAGVYEDIVHFQIEFARQIQMHDRVLILTDSAGYPRYEKALGAQAVVVFPMEDIWIRDFSPSNTEKPVLLRYTAAGQGGGRKGQRDADHVQKRFTDLARAAGLHLAHIPLLNDGGNFVDDYAGNIVVSRKFLADNKLSPGQAKRQLLTATGAAHVAFIEADEQGGLQHADGVVTFLDSNLLLVNQYPEDHEYAKSLLADLENALPKVQIRSIIAPWQAQKIHDSRFGSACGIYTNALVTRNRIYLPQFGIPEDRVALQQVQAASQKQVIPVPSDGVCHMGGGVRCLTWQVRGEDAKKLLRLANQ